MKKNIDLLSGKAAFEQAESMREEIEERIRERFKPEFLKDREGRVGSFTNDVITEVKKQLKIMYREYFLPNTVGIYNDYPESMARRGNVTLMILLSISFQPDKSKILEIEDKLKKSALMS